MSGYACVCARVCAFWTNHFLFYTTVCKFFLAGNHTQCCRWFSKLWLIGKTDGNHKRRSNGRIHIFSCINRSVLRCFIFFPLRAVLDLFDESCVFICTREWVRASKQNGSLISGQVVRIYLSICVRADLMRSNKSNQADGRAHRTIHM